MKFKQTLIGMVATCALTLGSVSPAYSQEKYSIANQQEIGIVNQRIKEHMGSGNYQAYSESQGKNIPLCGGEESIVAFALYCLIKKIEGRK